MLIIANLPGQLVIGQKGKLYVQATTCCTRRCALVEGEGGGPCGAVAVGGLQLECHITLVPRQRRQRRL